MARLHLICGNCGCADEWEWQHITEVIMKGDVMSDEDTRLTCNNCCTQHSINDNAKKKDS